MPEKREPAPSLGPGLGPRSEDPLVDLFLLLVKGPVMLGKPAELPRDGLVFGGEPPGFLEIFPRRIGLAQL